MDGLKIRIKKFNSEMMMTNWITVRIEKLKFYVHQGKTFQILKRFRWQREPTSGLTFPDQSNLWSDLSDSKSRVPSKCARSCLWSDFYSQKNSDPTEIRSLSRVLCKHGPNQIQTIVQRISRLKRPLIKLSPDQKSHWLDIFPRIVLRDTQIFSRLLS